MKNTLTCILLVFFINISFSQSKFTISDLDYFSDFEKDAFTKLQIDSTDSDVYLSLFLSSDSKSDQLTFLNTKNSIESVVQEIKNTKVFQKGGEKSIKLIYNTVHSRFFDKYSEGVLFTDIFLKKEYNCATASALYALIFQKLGIPYEVNYSDNHVFLVAYPSTKPILVETTNPLAGTMIYSKSFIDNYVDYLRKSKLISQSEYTGKPADVIFNEYFFKTNKGNIKTCAGILYFNQGINLFIKKEYIQAYQMGIRASLFLNEYTKTNFLMMGAAGSFLQQEDYNSITFFKVFAQITAFDDMISKNDTKNNVATYFRNFAIKGQAELLDSSFKTMNKYLKDTSLKNDIKSAYYKESGRLYYIKQDYNTAIEKFDSALVYSPEDKESELFWIDILPRVMENFDKPEKALEYMTDFLLRHPSLKNDSQILRVKSTAYLIMILYSLDSSDIVSSEKYLAMFTKEFPDNLNNSAINVDAFEKAIGDMAIFYFKKGQIKKSKEKAELGLRYFPHSVYINRIMNSLDN